MDQAFNILVVILSAALFIFLVLSIVATVLLVKLIKQFRSIVEKGSQIADDAAAFTHNITNAAGIAGFFRTFAGIFTSFKKGK